MSKETYFTEDYILRHGILAAVNEIITYASGMGINGMFESFEHVHCILAEYENRGANTIRDQIKDQCIFRYSKNKKYITDNWQFLTADVVKNLVENMQNSFRGIEKYQLCSCIENIYLEIDFAMRSITEHIDHIKNGVQKLYRIKKYHGKLVLLENDNGATFVMDRDTNKGFIGYFVGLSIIRDNTISVMEGDEYCIFKKREIDKKMYYELT